MILLRDILGLEPAGCDTNARYLQGEPRRRAQRARYKSRAG